MISLPYIFALVSQYGYKNLNIEKEKLYLVFEKSIIDGFTNRAIQSINVMSVEEQKKVFSFLIKTIEKLSNESLLPQILNRLIDIKNSIQNQSKIEILDSAILKIFKIAVDKTNDYAVMMLLLKKTSKIKKMGKDKYNEIFEYTLEKIKKFIKSNNQFFPLLYVINQLSEITLVVSDKNKKLVEEILKNYFQNLPYAIESFLFADIFILVEASKKINNIISRINYDQYKKELEKVFKILIKKYVFLINNNKKEDFYNLERFIGFFISFLKNIIKYDDQNRNMAEDGLSAIEDKVINNFKIQLIEESNKSTDYWIENFQYIENFNIITTIGEVSPKIKNQILKNIMQFLKN